MNENQHSAHGDSIVRRLALRLALTLITLAAVGVTTLTAFSVRSGDWNWGDHLVSMIDKKLEEQGLPTKKVQSNETQPNIPSAIETNPVSDPPKKTPAGTPTKARVPEATPFKEQEPPAVTVPLFDEPFRSAFAQHPELTKGSGGMAVVELPMKQTVHLLVTSSPLKVDTATGRADAEEVCEMLALSRLAEDSGVHLAAERKLAGAKVEREIKANASGVVRDIPVIGRWLSPDRTLVYVARGVVLDSFGNRLPTKLLPSKAK